MDFSNAPEGATQKLLPEVGQKLEVDDVFDDKGWRSCIVEKVSEKDGKVFVRVATDSEVLSTEISEYSSIKLRLPIPQQPYTPKVGEECEYHYSGSWRRAFYYGKSPTGKHILIDGNDNAELLGGLTKFRPLPTEEEVEREKLLSAWKGQSLENAHDTEASVLTVGEMIDFMMTYRQESE